MSISEVADGRRVLAEASERAASQSTIKVFWTCTALVWGGEHSRNKGPLSATPQAR